MRFDREKSNLQEKLRDLDSLMKVLQGLESAGDPMSEAPARRAVLPYGGERTIRSPKWQQTQESRA